MKKYVFYTLYLVVVVILLGEFIFFLLPALNQKPPPYDTALIDEELGWRPKPDYRFEGTMYSLDGTEYPIKITTDEHGFRTRPVATDTARERILIIGDSFTQAVEVSDDKTFYAHLERAAGAACHAHGMAGYGTLQELMILEEHLDRIDPTTVILQFCTNDFIDNELELEKTSKYHVGMTRPYLKSDLTIAYQSPLGRFERLINKTNFLKFCYERLRPKKKVEEKDTAEARIAANASDYAPYQASLQKTGELIGRVRQVVGPDRRLLVFCADPFQPQHTDIKNICRSRDVLFLPFPYEKFQAARANEEVYSMDGYHWNEYGHRLIAETLLEAL